MKALRLPVLEMKNSEVGLLLSYVPSCALRGRASFDPIWTNLIEVYKEMLQTKYQSSRLSSFRKEEFWKWASLFPYSNLWPRGQSQFWPQEHHIYKLGRGPQGYAAYQISKLHAFHFQRKEFWRYASLFLCSNLWPRGLTNFDFRVIIWTKLVEVHKVMLNTKYQSSRPSSFREQEFGRWSSLVLWPLGRASFDPRGIIWTNFVEVHKKMLCTKYQSSRPPRFREKEFWRWAFLFRCSNLRPWGGASFDPRGTIWTNLEEVH